MSIAKPSIIQERVALDQKNWFKTGGSAEFYCEPATVADFEAALAWARESGAPITILGAGANILIADSGISGLVIRPVNKNIEIAKPDEAENVDMVGEQGDLSVEPSPPAMAHAAVMSDVVLPCPAKPGAKHGTKSEAPLGAKEDTALLRVGAGCSMDELIEWSLDHQLLGLEEFSGIPGTVGGSVYINLHYYEFLLEHFLHEARVIELNTGKILTVLREWFNFGYDVSRLQDKEHILFDATFRLKKTDALGVAYARGRRVEIMRHRAARYPTKNTCGSFFRNFLPHEVTLESNGKKMIYVAYYLDKIGVKGTLSVGDAIVSHQHANMIVNKGSATSADIIALARMMQKMVHDQFGIMPQPECQLLGFAEYPLL